MRHIVVSSVIMLVAASLFVSPSLADPISYAVNGVFGAGTGTAPLSGPDGSFSVSFSLGQNPTPDFFSIAAGDFGLLGVPVTYSFLCSTCSTPTILNTTNDDVVFLTAAEGGMFLVEFIDGGHDYFFQFFGDQLFTGSVDHPTLLPVTGDFAARGRFQLDDNEFVDLGTPTVAVSTPEPSTLALMFAALASLGLIAFVKTQRT